MTKEIAGKTLEQWKENPYIKDIIEENDVFWINDKKGSFEEEKDQVEYTGQDVKDAEDRLKRFAPWLEMTFEDTKKLNGLIESPYSKIDQFKADVEARYDTEIIGDLYLKRDDLLPIAGTIKARGAIYEVLVHAEKVAIEQGLLSGYDDDYTKFASDEFQNYFKDFSVVVGTTGNLGISVGVMAAAFGFKAIVHMSSEAKQWKKDYLRQNGVEVIEHNTNFTEAVEQGRAASEADPNSYFVDDENSEHLFLGYTTAASRLKAQLEDDGIVIDDDHPLFLYLPCGVGGSPGGITFGAKHTFGDNVYAFFAEPTHVPSLILGLLTGEYSNVSVNDFGIDGKTVMDGLAVPRTSQFVAKVMEHFFDGGYTLSDEESNRNLTRLVDTEDIFLEPAATAGLSGAAFLFKTEEGQKFIQDKGLTEKMANATHVAWATGGSMVPEEDRKKFYEAGK
ncbi:D-serine ammonia-lyase [Aerococcus kribbianus]|uniref:Probable D-serine dehydratase n=1 Tax=Aerococcus kribbianus TaxID=2999064 RepID=A0A9X3FPM8_9LACT|nr:MULTISPECIES: D-serine ammonia-lyase [unclassified Aerococcus]MCZ0717271.1 D-serine ammonia-lyase [Aerococcus sp. YH-aer221]MCZ0725559.1 D-serine ammonia-lyase [Aerococcus sp. YH-aer222]